MSVARDGRFVLSVIIPCYNSEAYMVRAVDSALGSATDTDVEVIIVDDGSSDGTGSLAEEYARRLPERIVAVRQENRGHGGAVNSGLAVARGEYVKVLDSDDWFDADAYGRLLAALRGFAREGKPVDMVVVNFVYEKEGSRRKKTMRYRGTFPTGRVFTWDESGLFGLTRYLLMHSVVYRAEVVRESGLRLPEKTFYVDNLFVAVPMPYVRTLCYLDENLYRYYIGRADQSVNETVMIKRIDQQLWVNYLMLDNLLSARVESPKLREAMLHYFEIITAISSVMLIRKGDEEAYAKKDELWETIREQNPVLYATMTRRPLGMIVNLTGTFGRIVTTSAYSMAQRIFGFN